jgi:hypothetical protein
VASHDTLIRLFERINFFLQRLNIYTKIPPTTDMTELLGKIMAELLSILALSTKEMTDRRMSESTQSLAFFLAYYGPEKFLKRLLGRTDVEDALQRLDTLTKEETLMAVTRNLEITHHADGNVMVVKGIVHNIDGDVKAIKEVICGGSRSVEVTKGLSHDVGAGVEAIKDVIPNLDGNVKETKALTENIAKTVTDQLKRSFHPDDAIVCCRG